MKKSKFLLSFIVTGAFTAPFLVLTSCNKNTSHFDDIPTEKKEKTAEEGQATCTYSFDLKNELQSGQSIKIELTQTSGSEGVTGVELTKDPVVSGKTITFETKLVFATNNSTSHYSVFDVNITCIDSASQPVWEEKITNFKQTIKSEVHSVSATSKVNNVEVSVDPSFFTESSVVTLKFNNKRTTPVTDANLTVKVNSEYVNIAIPFIGHTDIPVGESSVEFTKAAIQVLFPSFSENDPVEFILVRSGAYEVKDYQLYQYDDLGDTSLVSDAELETLATAKTFLVKDAGSDDLILSKITFPAFIDSCNVANATRDLYFIGGTFFNEAHGAPALTTLNIHGLLKNDKQTKLATLRVYRDYVSQEYNEGLNAGNIKFNLYNLKVQGRDGCRESGRNDYQEGMMCPNINATDCYFSGAYTLWYGHSVFENCTFDSRNTYKMAGTNQIKNNYPMYLYSDTSAEFKKCTFESIGKSLKVYSDGALTHDLDALSLDECTFNLYVPSIEGHPEYTMAEEEFPINIDASNSKSCDYKYKVVIKSNCSANQYWKTKKTGVADNKLYWAISAVDPNETTVARNILINGEKIAPDQQPNKQDF